MRYVILTNTPAHVHLYKFAVRRLQADGHDVKVLARDYGCTVELAEAFDLPYTIYGSCDTNKASLVTNLPSHYLNIIKETLRYDPDLIFGMGAYAAHAGAVSRTPTVLVLDSEPTQVDHLVSKPFADAMLTPDSFRRVIGPNHYAFPGFKECAYLHPEIFEQDDDIRSALGIGSEPFVLLRFNAFGSHHDVSKGGFTSAQRRQLIRDLADHATVFVSDEGNECPLENLPARPFNLPPERLHDALAEASLLVADTQTMVTEAALLGTPAIRSNSFVGDDDMGNFIELARRGLVDNLATFSNVRSRALEILQQDGIQKQYQQRRQRLFEEKVNLTDVLVEVATNHEQLERVSALSRDWERPDPGQESETAVEPEKLSP